MTHQALQAPPLSSSEYHQSHLLVNFPATLDHSRSCHCSYYFWRRLDPISAAALLGTVDISALVPAAGKSVPQAWKPLTPQNHCQNKGCWPPHSRKCAQSEHSHGRSNSYNYCYQRRFERRHRPSCNWRKPGPEGKKHDWAGGPPGPNNFSSGSSPSQGSNVQAKA